MLLSPLSQCDRYAGLHPLLPRAFEFIRDGSLAALPPGRHPILDRQLFVIVDNATARTREAAQLERHCKYIDIQLVLDGMEEMGWRPLADCTRPVSDYNPELDLQFFHDAPLSWILTPPDAFCIFFPEDAHAPLVGSGGIRKAVFKIAVDPATI